MSDNENYKGVYIKLEEYQKDGFKNEITKEEISNDGKIEFDYFYMVEYNLLSKIKLKDFETDDIDINFYNNVCEPLYKKDEE